MKIHRTVLDLWQAHRQTEKGADQRNGFNRLSWRKRKCRTGRWQ